MGPLRGSPSPPAKGSRGESPRSPARSMASEDLLGNALDRTLLRRIFACVWPYRGRLLAAVALLPVVAVLEIAQPDLFKKGIDEHITVGRLAGGASPRVLLPPGPVGPEKPPLRPPSS